MKFADFKQPEYYAPVKKLKIKFWSKARCKLLVDNFYILDEVALRKLLGGASYSNIRAKATQLQKYGWSFKQP